MTRKSKATLDAERDNAIQRLQDILTRGDTIYTILAHRSRSGMTSYLRPISLQVVHGEPFPRNLSSLVSLALGRKPYHIHGDNTVRASGVGLNIGAHVVETLSLILFNDPHALRHEWL